MTETARETKPLFDRLYEGAQRIKVDGETYWRVEGDILLDEKQLRLYALRQDELKAAAMNAAASQRLVAMVDEGGKFVRWAPGVELSYCVLRRTFAKGGEDGYRLVVDSIRRAAQDWEKTCGVKFAHRSDQDDSDLLRPEGLLFVVREIDAAGKLIASAFFPNDPVDRRHVLIDPSFYEPDLGYDKIGVLRHELGHVLGFRHEHIRSGAPPGCPDEDVYDIKELGPYDGKSVMHYFCGGEGSKTLEITELDKAGALSVYGPPFAEFRFMR